MRRRRAALITLVLLAPCLGGAGLWLRVEQRQYALNRALITALRHGDDKGALALVKAGADPNTHYRPTPVPSLLKLVKQLFHRSPPPVNNSPTALLLACGPSAWWDESTIQSSDAHIPDTISLSLVEAMLRHGAKVNAQDTEGRTALEDAAIPNSISVVGYSRQINMINAVRLLLQHGANVNIRDKEGNTPLLDCASDRDTPADVLTLLLDYGADVNAKGLQDGCTPLMRAIDSPEHVRVLLAHGATVNIQDNHGMTALFWAVSRMRRHMPITSYLGVVIQQLLAHGADPNLADSVGHSPLTLVQGGNNPDFVALFKQSGARK